MDKFWGRPPLNPYKQRKWAQKPLGMCKGPTGPVCHVVAGSQKVPDRRRQAPQPPTFCGFNEFSWCSLGPPSPCAIGKWPHPGPGPFPSRAFWKPILVKLLLWKEVLPGPLQASPGRGPSALQTHGWAVPAPLCPMAQAEPSVAATCTQLWLLSGLSLVRPWQARRPQ